MHVALEVLLNKLFFDLQQLAISFRNSGNVGDSEIARLFEMIDHLFVLKAFPHCPKRKYERKPGEKSPALSQIKHFKRLRTETHQGFLLLNIRALVDFHEPQ